MLLPVILIIPLYMCVFISQKHTPRERERESTSKMASSLYVYLLVLVLGGALQASVDGHLSHEILARQKADRVKKLSRAAWGRVQAICRLCYSQWKPWKSTVLLVLWSHPKPSSEAPPPMAQWRYALSFHLHSILVFFSPFLNIIFEYTLLFHSSSLSLFIVGWGLELGNIPFLPLHAFIIFAYFSYNLILCWSNYCFDLIHCV